MLFGARPSTLRYLVERPGQLVTKAALLDAVWGEVTVSDSMPAVCVSELRKALSDEAKTPRFIETVHGRGYRFIAPVGQADTPSAVRPPALAPVPPSMVGREDELAQVKGWFAKSCEGTRQVVFVAGEPGIGKTTFVTAFLAMVAREGAALVGRGQCIEQYGAGEPYMPVLEGLTRLCREPEGARLLEVLSQLAPTWLAQMPAVLSEGELSRIRGQGATRQPMLLREMTQALEALSAQMPLVLLLEDLHWSDAPTLDLIAALARRTEPARLLILGTYRLVEMLAGDHPLRSLKEELEIHQQCEELRLKLLSEAEVAAYLKRRFANDGTQFSDLAPAIYQRSDGNPLFMVNVVDYLVAQGPQLDASKIETPRNIRQMIEHNLERLTADEQNVLESASVVGAEFSAAAVAAALERPVSEVEACCTRLSRREQFIDSRDSIEWPDGTVASNVRFLHALYREVLYDRVPPGHRVELHRRIAAREETAYGERAGEIAAELADHYRRANDKQKAIQYFQLAGERAAARGATVQAERHYSRALRLLAELPENVERDKRELELQLAVGPALMAIKGFAAPEVERTFTRARKLCERLGDSPEIFPVLFGLWGVHFIRGQFRTAHQLAEQLLRRSQTGHAPALLLFARFALGLTSFWQGKFLIAREHLEIAISLYEPERDRRFAHGTIDFGSGRF